MPDRRQGYVKRKQGILDPDPELARRYRHAMRGNEVHFTSEIQLVMMKAMLESCEKQHFELFFFATESTHLHILVGWRDVRPWLRMRSTLKGSVTRRLNLDFGQREWFREGGSRKRVIDHKHFNYLRNDYLPKHSGWKWDPDKGRFR